MASFFEPRPICASATAEEAKETFPEFLRAPWVPAGAEEAAAGGEGAGVGCGLGEDWAEHKDTVPAERPQKPLLLGVWSAEGCGCAARQTSSQQRMSWLGSRVVGSVRSAAESWLRSSSAACTATTGAALQTSP